MTLKTRRKFLGDAARGGSIAAIASTIPVHNANAFRSTLRMVGLEGENTAQLADPAGVRLLALRAIDAAKSAGAQYADVRLTRTVQQSFRAIGTYGRYFSFFPELPGIGEHDYPPTDVEQLAVGVRVLVDGCWGFAASPFWSTEEMPILANEAALQAIVNAKATPRRVELSPTPVVTGHWRQDGVIDPFSIPPEEKLDAVRDVADYPGRLPSPMRYQREDRLSSEFIFAFSRQERALATSDGTYCTQDIFALDTTINIRYEYGQSDGGGFGPFPIDFPNQTGRGWEAFDEKLIKQRTAEAVDRFYSTPTPNARGVDVGRYDVVCTAPVAAQLVDVMLGAPTQVDRAFGYEANRSGTSYIDDPLGMLGNFKIGTDLLTVTGDRRMEGGLATVKWDDEGVVPQDITLVKNGVLSDLQTTRESSAWIGDYYSRLGGPVKSNGSAASESALSFTLGHTPNLTMHPGTGDATFDSLVRDTKKGIAILRGTIDVDFQARNGVCRAEVPRSPDIREIVDGELGDAIHGAGMIFEATSFWKTLLAIGGSDSSVTIGASSTKGEPESSARFSVSAVPIKVREATIIDVLRRG